MQTTFDFVEGEVLLIDKPLKWTSFDVVNKIRWAIKLKKIGHAGTLDPLATGLLILCTGKKTKQIDQFQAQEKEYTGVLVFGKTTPSIDLETDFDSETNTDNLQESQIREAVETFKGLISQFPPQYSAVKIGGKPAYLSARKGKNVEVKSREVTVYEFEITALALPSLHFRIRCSKGTYIRSLVKDLGDKLGVGAYLAELRRTKIGDFDVKNAWQVQDLIEKIKNTTKQ
ncbi:MAG: tRNA pseudouridine(55) synthase TruB [Bacteroidetes bacterium]|nr:MAG: tRNA pseudouridine(55) synthase TruB [Bacteroidota bacterium]